jgi:hypothetical protein
MSHPCTLASLGTSVVSPLSDSEPLLRWRVSRIASTDGTLDQLPSRFETLGFVLSQLIESQYPDYELFLSEPPLQHASPKAPFATSQARGHDLVHDNVVTLSPGARFSPHTLSGRARVGRYAAELASQLVCC